MTIELSMLFDQNLKSQIMTTNLWVEQFWKDYKLQWDPEGIALAGTLYA
jgi:nicotinic acetylcholine receptor